MKVREAYERAATEMAALLAQGEVLTDEDRKLLVAEYAKIYFTIYQQYKIGVVSALPKEAAAVRLSVDDEQPLYNQISGMTYTSGTIPAAHDTGTHFIVSVQAPKMGNSAAAIAAMGLLKDFPNLTDVIMVGIAGGVPNAKSFEKDVRLGDLVVSRDKGLVQYDMTKIEDKEIIVRCSAPPPSQKLIAVVDRIEQERIAHGRRPWEQHIDRCTKLENGRRPPDDTDEFRTERKYAEADDARRKPGFPVVFFGTIGSANSLVKKNTLRDELAQKFNVLAVEMEGSGIADATWFYGVGYLIIRGICDYCDGRKGDRWQGYAAAVAAAYFRSVLEALPNN